MDISIEFACSSIPESMHTDDLKCRPTPTTEIEHFGIDRLYTYRYCIHTLYVAYLSTFHKSLKYFNMFNNYVNRCCIEGSNMGDND